MEEIIKMKNRKYNKLQLGLLTVILALSLLASNILIVKADAGGTGKFLTIDFGIAVDISDCYVVATKSSGQSFTFLANNSATFRQKVGAGDVILEAFPDIQNGWKFNYFEDLDGVKYLNSSVYKTEKLDILYAVFDVLTFDLDISIIDGLGEIWLLDADEKELVAYQYIDAQLNPNTVPIPYGSSPEFEFVPLDGYHLSTVFNGTHYIDLVLTEFTQVYQFPPIYSEDNSLDVIFSIDGQASIQSGNDVVVFLSSGVSLSFPEVSSGTAFGNPLTPVIDGDVVVWNITVDATLVDPSVELAFQFPQGSIPDTILTCLDQDFELFLKCDLNNDGKVDGKDVHIISNIVKKEKFYPDDITDYDLYPIGDPDGIIDENDIHVVNSFNGMDYDDFVWVPLTSIVVDANNYVIYGITDHFSIFRCR
jgi:hypothetical protein